MKTLAAPKPRDEGRAEAKAFVVVRLRGSIQTRHTVETALLQFHLTRKNHATVLPNDATARGTLQKVKDYVTWGPATAATVQLLLDKRGETADGKRLDAKKVAELAPALAAGTLRLGTVRGVKPVFRLNPPRKGLKSMKLTFPAGDLGYRGARIDDLVSRMV